MSAYGVNYPLTSFMHHIYGKQVLVETKNGDQYIGVMKGFSIADLEFGLEYAWKRTAENLRNIFPKKSEIERKMIFRFSDIITVSAIWSDEKANKTFATDRDYHSRRKSIGSDEELQAWECDEADEIDICEEMPDQNQAYKRHAGWNVDAMFDTNSRLHKVQSTFKEDMSQYTTVTFEETIEGRAHADTIARQIEQNQLSNLYCRLENDDTERDLDKETNIRELEKCTATEVKEPENNLPELDNNAECGLICGRKRSFQEASSLPDDNKDICGSDDSNKKFSFNPDAPAFMPRSAEMPNQEYTAVVGPPPGMLLPPPGMSFSNTPPMMAPQWQGYIMPGQPYPIYYQVPIPNMHMPRTNPHMANYSNHPTSRRNATHTYNQGGHYNQFIPQGYYPHIPPHGHHGHQYSTPPAQSGPTHGHQGQPPAQMHHQPYPSSDLYCS